ncbi:hypothetical protein Emag_000611 [Eimeria magna]
MAPSPALQQQQQQQQQQHRGVCTVHHHYGIVVPLPSLLSCFASLGGPPSAACLWQQHQRHFCRVLQLQRLRVSAAASEDVEVAYAGGPLCMPALAAAKAAAAAGAPQVYVGWIGAGLGPADTAAVRDAAAAAPARANQTEDVVCVGLAASLCSLLGLEKGESVVVAAVDLAGAEQQQQQQQQQQLESWPHTPSLEVAPLTRDDWDAVHLHAQELEEQVLNQVALLMPGQAFPLWIGGGSKPALLRVCTPHEAEGGQAHGAPLPPFFLLSQNTELHVRPLIQAAFRRGHLLTGAAALADQIGAHGIGADLLRVLPLPGEAAETATGGDAGLGCERSSSCCCCCSRGSGVAPAGDSWPYFCLLHPAYVEALQQQQQWLRPALRSRLPLPRAVSPRAGHKAAQRRQQGDRLAAAEDVALVCVRRPSMHDLEGEQGRERQRSHALLAAAASPHVALGCVRLPPFVRRLYGWPLSSRVAVEAYRPLPVLPPLVLLTPLVPPPPSSPVCTLHGEASDHAAAARAAAAFVSSGQGSKRLIGAFLAMAHAEEPDTDAASNEAASATAATAAAAAAAARPSAHSNSIPAAARALHAREGALLRGAPHLRALWDGALVRLSLPVSEDELRCLQQPDSNKEGGEVSSLSESDRLVKEESRARSGQETVSEVQQEERLLLSELEELEAGLNELYVSPEVQGDVKETADSQLVDCLPATQNNKDVGREEQLVADSNRGEETPEETPAETAKETPGFEWDQVAACCSVVDECPFSSLDEEAQIQEARAQAVSCEDDIGSRLLAPQVQVDCPAAAATGETQLLVEILVSFNAAAGFGETPARQGTASPRRQRRHCPLFSHAVPPAFAGLCEQQHTAAPAAAGAGAAGARAGPAACVLLDASFFNLVQQGAVLVEVTRPLSVLMSCEDAIEREAELRLPLRLNCLLPATQGPANSSPSSGKPLSLDTPSGFRSPTGETACSLPPLQLNAEALDAAQRLWWLAPPSLFTEPHASLSRGPASKPDEQLLQLLKQGCVEVLFAEPDVFSLCSCSAPAAGVSILHSVMKRVSNPQPRLEDFHGLRAFGDFPATLVRAGKQQLKRLYRRLGYVGDHSSCLGASKQLADQSHPSATPTGALEAEAVELQARRALQTADVSTLLVCGPRGSGRSTLCRALCLDVTRRLGVFTIVVYCRLLAREALPSALVRGALAAAFEAAAANRPSIDVLCFSGEDGGDRHSVAEARGSLLASFLSDEIRRVSGAQTLAHSCARGSVGEFSRLQLLWMLRLFTPPSPTHSFSEAPSCTCAATPLLRALLELVTACFPNNNPFTSLMEKPGDSCALIPDSTLLTEAHLWNIANKLEGYSLADLKAVVTRAVGESLLSRPVELSRHLNLNRWSVREAGRQQAVLQHSHLVKAAEEVQPRATQQQSFIQPDLRYRHVGGMHRAKEDLQDLLTLQRAYPSLLRASGISVHQGVLLVGPPGCGKTHLALAAVGEARIRCIHVKGPELLGKFIGSSEAAVKAVFQRAEAAKPCAILFDEIEALATKRGGDTTGVTDRVVNQLLCYLDGFETREDVFVIATTSRPDLVCFCGLPLSEAERTEILAVSLKALNADCSFDVEAMGHVVPWTFSPADIQTHAVQEVIAAEPAEQDTRYPETVTIGDRHFLAALECSSPSLSVHELQRYHRYCLPFLSRAYQEQVHAVERLITLSAKQTKANAIDKIAGPQSLNNLQSNHVLPVTQTTAADFHVEGSDSNGMHEGAFLESLTKPSSSEPGDEAGSGESEKSPAIAAHSPSKRTEGLCTKSFSDPKKQPKRRRRKRALAHLPGNRVALA